MSDRTALFGALARVAPRDGAAEAVTDQMNAVAARFFLRDAPELRGGIAERLPSRILEI